jgi:hypothetical protein
LFLTETDLTPTTKETPKPLGELVWWATPEADLAPADLAAALEAHGLGGYLADKPAYAAADVAALFQKVALDTMSPFQVRPRSGVHFVPAARLDAFVAFGKALLAAGGDVSHSPVPDTPAGRKIARDAVRDGLARQTDEYARTIAGYSPDTDSRTLKAMGAKLTALRARAGDLADLLGDARGPVAAGVEEARAAFREKAEAATQIAC